LPPPAPVIASIAQSTIGCCELDICRDALPPLAGGKDRQNFVDRSVAIGASAAWFDGAAAIGPLASFDRPDRWVDRPYRDGIALIGDAAAARDPCFGGGLALALRDVRTLRDCSAAEPDWAAASAAYAVQHHQYFRSLHHIHE
jgi:2-polyprenyl-6-methoxyphenol hydroxylase-like FAD-dependent oxidoreductase